MNAERTSFVYVTFIASTPEKVFDALINADLTRQYWGHANVSDWKPGSTWAHVGNETGTTELVGEVVEITPPTRLVITWANASQAGDPTARSRVTFALDEYPGMVKLTVSHDDLVAGSGMANGVSKGWPIVLSSLKSFLEAGRGLDVFAKPKAGPAQVETVRGRAS